MIESPSLAYLPKYLFVVKECIFKMLNAATFKLKTNFTPAGDQPFAVKKILKQLKDGEKNVVLLGVTGSGKTFTMANVIAKLNRNVVVVSHNKTLASQLYSEFKEFFPNNNVEYYISYFDFYRPEAYLPHEDVYINKLSAVNSEIEALRLSALNALSRKNEKTIVVASVAAIYSTMQPESYNRLFFELQVGETISPSELAGRLIRRGYERNNFEQKPGSFSVKGEVIEIVLGWAVEYVLKVVFFGNKIEDLVKLSAINKSLISKHLKFTIYPAKEYQVGNRQKISGIVKDIYKELAQQVENFTKQQKITEAERLNMRVKKDVDDLQEFGIFRGIENYARYFDGRLPGEKPFTLFDFLAPEDLIIIDESHIMVPQIGGMYQGDFSRKTNLVEYGFRLPSALDNRPLKFTEFESLPQQKVFVSATPGEYELNQGGEIIKQIIRPTGLLEPIIEVRKTEGQIEDIYNEIIAQRKKNDRSLVLTTTKKTAEEIAKFFQKKGLKSAYLHSEYKTFQRDEILRKLRRGVFEVVVGINLLREGIDLPEVSLICVLQADNESFLRNWRSLIQLSGRAARNDHGRVLFYADKISMSMQVCIDDNLEKRQIQERYNHENNITPKTVVKPIHEPLSTKGALEKISRFFAQKGGAASKEQTRKELAKEIRSQMLAASRRREYEKAAELRDLLLEISNEVNLNEKN